MFFLYQTPNPQKTPKMSCSRKLKVERRTPKIRTTHQINHLPDLLRLGRTLRPQLLHENQYNRQQEEDVQLTEEKERLEK